MKNVTIAMRRKEARWNGAIVIDGQFQDAFSSEFNLGDIVTEQLAPLLDTLHSKGRVTINVTVDE